MSWLRNLKSKNPLPMPIDYTHDFHFKYGDQNITGEVEFNIDNKATLRYPDGVELDSDEAVLLAQIITQLKRLTHEFGTIDKFKVTEK